MVPKFGTKIGPKRADTNRYTPSGCTVRANTQQRHPQPKHDIFHAGHIALQVCVSEPLCCFPVVCRFQFNLSYKIAGLRVMVAVGHPQALVPHTHTHTHSGCTVRANAQQRHPKPKHLCFVLNSFSCKFVFHFCSGRGPQFWDQNWFQFWDQIWFRADLYLILIVFKVGPSFGPKFGTEFGPKIRNHVFISVSFVCQFWFNLSHTIARLRVVFAAGRPPALVPHIIGVRSVRIHSSGTHTHQVRHVHIGHSFCKFVFRDRFHCALFSRVCKFQLCISNKITQYWLRGPSASTWATGRSQWVSLLVSALLGPNLVPKLGPVKNEQIKQQHDFEFVDIALQPNLNHVVFVGRLATFPVWAWSTSTRGPQRPPEASRKQRPPEIVVVAVAAVVVAVVAVGIAVVADAVAFAVAVVAAVATATRNSQRPPQDPQRSPCALGASPKASEAARGRQRSSDAPEATRGPQKPSEGPRGHQRTPKATRRPQRPPKGPRGHQRPPEATRGPRGHQRPLEGPIGAQMPAEGPRSHQRPPETPRGRQRPPEGQEGPRGPQRPPEAPPEAPRGASGGFWGPLEAFGPQWDLLVVSGGLWGLWCPLGASGGLWGPLEASGVFWWPLGSSDGLWGPLVASGALWWSLGHLVTSGGLWRPQKPLGQNVSSRRHVSLFVFQTQN